MPIKQYTVFKQVPQSASTVQSWQYSKCFSFADADLSIHLQRGDRADLLGIQDTLWFGDHGKWKPSFEDLIDASDKIWFVRFDKEERTDLTRRIQNEMKIGKLDAAVMKDRLFEEIDQIARTREVGPL